MIKRLLIIFFCLFLMAGVTTIHAEDNTEEVISYEELKGKKVGIQTGSILDRILPNIIEDVQIVYYESLSDMREALLSGKVDAISADEPKLRYMAAIDSQIVYRKDVFEYMEYAFIFNKDNGKALCNEFNQYVKKIKDNGFLDEMINDWFDPKQNRDFPDYESLPNKNGVISYAIDAQLAPFCFVKDGKYAGLEVEIMTRFCEERGYALEITNVQFASLTPGVYSGKYNIASSCITITDERKQSVLFSDPTYIGGSTLAIRKENTGSESFLNSLIDSFNKTFIREDRYKLFLQGIGTTLLITLLSVLFGTILGFIIFLLCHKGNEFANWLAKLFSTIMTGLPIVVLLMILYYVVFGNSSISGAAVSIIGFSLVFSAEVFSMMNNAVKAVDYGQNEAAYALGYGYWSSFFRYILPQAIPHFLPPYRGSLVSLVKATAIVGYVAVQDLTKMGDIVRSRTYEAFFPLIAIAIIYFVLGRLLVFVIDRLTLFLDPSRRSKKDILKGIETHD